MKYLSFSSLIIPGIISATKEQMISSALQLSAAVKKPITVEHTDGDLYIVNAATLKIEKI